MILSLPVRSLAGHVCRLKMAEGVECSIQILVSLLGRGNADV
jgi:hypothetical protein